MNIVGIVNLVTYLFFGIAILIGLIPTIVLMFRRSGAQSLVRFCCYALGLAGAMLICIFLSEQIINAGLTIVQRIAGGSVADEIILYLQGGTSASVTMMHIIGALVVPMLFFAVYIVSEFIFFIIYLIISKCAFGKRNKKRGVVSVLVSIVLNLAICFVALTTFFMPACYYSGLVQTALSSGIMKEFVGENNNTFDNVEESLNVLSSNPIYKVFAPLASYEAMPLTVIEIEGNKVTLEKFLPETLDTVNSINSLLKDGGDSLKPSDFTEIALDLEKKPVLDVFIGKFLADASTEWLKGEEFLGIKAYTIYNEDVSQEIYGELSKGAKASTELKAVAAIIASANSMAGGEGSADELYESIKNLDQESLEILKNVTSEKVIGAISPDLDEGVSQAVSGVIGDIYDGLYDITNDENLTQEERDEKLKKETEKVDKVMNMLSGSSDEETDVEEIVEIVTSSSVILSSVANNLTEENAQGVLNEIGLNGDGAIGTITCDVIKGLDEINKDTSKTEEEKEAEIKQESKNISSVINKINSSTVDTAGVLKDICNSPVMTASAAGVLTNPEKSADLFKQIGITNQPAIQQFVSSALIKLNASNLSALSAAEKAAVRANTGAALAAAVAEMQKGASADVEALVNAYISSDITKAAIIESTATADGANAFISEMGLSGITANELTSLFGGLNSLTGDELATAASGVITRLRAAQSQA